MMWLLKMLIFGHVHKWEEDRRTQIGRVFDGEWRATHDRIEYKCTKCVKRKVEDLLPDD